MMSGLRGIVVGVVALAVLIATTNAGAAHSVANGRIAFSKIDPSSGDTSIYTIRPDSSGLRHVTGPFTDAPAWSPDGHWIAYHDYGGSHGVRLFVVRGDGTQKHQVTFHPGDQGYPTWSPDGTRLAFDGNWPDGSALGIHVGIGIVDLATGHVREITFFRSKCHGCVFADGNPVWSPDGRLIAFERLRNNRRGLSALFTVRPDGTHLRRLTSFQLDPGPPSWAPDGSKILFNTNDEKTDGATLASDLATVPRNGGPIAYLTHNDPTVRACFQASYAPDGRHIVFIGYHFGDSHNTLKIMGADGNGRRKVRTGFPFMLSPDWGVRPTG